MPRQLLICAKEREYAKRLAEYIAGQKEVRFAVNYCADMATGHQLAESLHPDYLLVDGAFTCEERAGFAGERRFVLSEEARPQVEEGETGIFKYSSGRTILDTVMRHSLDDRGLVSAHMDRESVRVIGFYSPVKRVGQTSLALAIGARLAGEDGALYLNLCTHAAGGHFPKHGGSTIDQFLYYLEQHAPNPGLRIKSMAAQLGEMDYLRPVELREDLEDVREDTWLQLMEMLQRETPYGYVLLDLGDEVCGIHAVLECCTLVYMPVLADEFSAAKVAAFSHELKRVGHTDLIRKIRKITMDKDMSVIAESCVRTIQAEGRRDGATGRHQAACLATD